MDIREQKLVTGIFNEITTAQTNQNQDDTDYESYLGILSGERDEKTYDWQSDIRIPVFMAHHLTQSAIEAGQNFQTRDFVEVKINDPSEIAKLSAESAKECLNRTLTRRDLYYYQKFIRGKGINNLSGRVWLKCWWEQEFEERQIGTRIEIEELDVDVNGDPLVEDWQVPATRENHLPVFEEVAVKDKFNYDVWDQRNVFTSNEYVYSAQQKEWIIFRSESTLSKLESLKDQNQYFNLDKIGKPPETTETKEESYQKNNHKNEPKSTAQTPFDVYERYGKAWIKNGKIGIGSDGEILDGAKYEECIITIVKDNHGKTLIGFNETHFVDADGNPYKPCIRGLCYIHPSDDNGMGDGQNIREIQTAIDDTFNVSQDRTILSTLPSLKGKRNSVEDNTSIIIEPMGMMMLDDPADVQEFKISPDTMGALQQLAYLEDKGSQVDMINETTTGGVPSIASTTATAVASASQGTNTRQNYKALTYTYTVDVEFYWMILQMTYAFAQEETAIKLMGDKAYNFNPSLDYYYSPLAQSIEPESSKEAKRQKWLTIYQIAMNSQHPDAPRVANQAYGEFVKLMGDEFESSAFLDESQPMQPGEQTPEQGGVPTQNEYGQPQSMEEMGARAYA